MTTARCPRCSGALRAPGLMSSDWECAVHGAVAPLTTHLRPTAESVRQLAARPGVPLWAPLPLLPHWTLASVACAGDDDCTDGPISVETFEDFDEPLRQLQRD